MHTSIIYIRVISIRIKQQIRMLREKLTDTTRFYLRRFLFEEQLPRTTTQHNTCVRRTEKK